MSKEPISDATPSVVAVDAEDVRAIAGSRGASSWCGVCSRLSLSTRAGLSQAVLELGGALFRLVYAVCDGVEQLFQSSKLVWHGGVGRRGAGGPPDAKFVSSFRWAGGVFRAVLETGESL